jgi:hypothetical protein
MDRQLIAAVDILIKHRSSPIHCQSLVHNGRPANGRHMGRLAGHVGQILAHVLADVG